MKKKICEFCGEPLNKNDIFCRGCGAKIDNNEEVKDAVIEGEKSKNTTFITSIIVLLLLVIVIAGLFILLR